jgi:hypothetical protein
MRPTRISPLAPFALCGALLVAALPAASQMPWASFGARQVALGGASAALGGDPAGFVGNPALLTPEAYGGVASYGQVAVSSNGFVPLLEGVTGRDPAELARPGNPDAAAVRANLSALSVPGTSVLGDGQSAIATALKGWGIFVGSVVYSAAVARADLVHVESGYDPATSFAANDSVVAFRALSLQDYAVSRAMPFFDGALVLGVTGHFTRGTTGIKEESAFVTDVGKLTTFVRRGTTGLERTRSRWSWDAGAVLNIGILQLGGVMKGINRPQFPFDDEAPPEDRGTTAVLGRQTRVGASIRIPGLKMRIAADLDLEKNETLAEGQLSRVAGGGIELPLGKFDLRGGASVNLEAPDRPWVYSFGIGFGSAKARLDAAGTYRDQDRAYGAVLTSRFGF